jgi:hypothetical protein
VARIRVLPAEGSSLTAREVLTGLGPSATTWRHSIPTRSVSRGSAAGCTVSIDARVPADERSRADAQHELLDQASGAVMAQEPAVGQYGQVQGLFDRGRPVAAHTSVQTGIGIGPSAAARLSVDHPRPRRDIATLGEALTWHGGLTLDYLHVRGNPSYIECNPRTVEPGNAAASGLSFGIRRARQRWCSSSLRRSPRPVKRPQWPAKQPLATRSRRRRSTSSPRRLACDQAAGPVDLFQASPRLRVSSVVARRRGAREVRPILRLGSGAGGAASSRREETPSLP